jgi:hypothetical protein
MVDVNSTAVALANQAAQQQMFEMLSPMVAVFAIIAIVGFLFTMVYIFVALKKVDTTGGMGKEAVKNGRNI